MSDTWTEGGSYEPGRVVRTTVSIRVRRKWWEWLLRRPVQYRQEDRYYRAFHRDDPADMAGPDARLRLPYRLGLQASRVYERSTWEGLDAGRGRDYERRDALDDSRAALTAAFRSARGEGT